MTNEGPATTPQRSRRLRHGVQSWTPDIGFTEMTIAAPRVQVPTTDGICAAASAGAQIRKRDNVSFSSTRANLLHGGLRVGRCSLIGA